MNKANKAKNREWTFKEKAKYKDIFQKRSMRLRINETMIFGFVMILTAGWLPTMGGWLYEALIVLAAIIIIGGAPLLYQKVMAPEYVLTKTHLSIWMRGKERIYPLTEVERASKWKAVYRLHGKKEPVMASNAFLDRLDEQLEKIGNGKDKRR